MKIKLEEKFNNYYKKLEEQLLNEQSEDEYKKEINNLLNYGAADDEEMALMRNRIYRDPDLSDNDAAQRRLARLTYDAAEEQAYNDKHNNDEDKSPEEVAKEFLSQHKHEFMNKDFSKLDDLHYSNYKAYSILLDLLLDKFDIFDLVKWGVDGRYITDKAILSIDSNHDDKGRFFAIPQDVQKVHGEVTFKSNGIIYEILNSSQVDNKYNIIYDNYSALLAANKLNKQISFHIRWIENAQKKIVFIEDLGQTYADAELSELATKLYKYDEKVNKWKSSHEQAYNQAMENPEHQLYSNSQKAQMRKTNYDNRKLKKLGLSVGSQVKFTNIDPNGIERSDVKELEDRYSRRYGWYRKAIDTGYKYVFTLTGGMKVMFDLMDDEPNSRTGKIDVRDYKKIASVTGEVKRLENDILVLDAVEITFRESTIKNIVDNIKDKLQYIHRARYRIDLVYDEATNKYYKVSEKDWEKLAKQADAYYNDNINREKRHSMAVTGVSDSNNNIVYANASMALKLNKYNSKRGNKLYDVCEGNMNLYEFGDMWRYATREDIMQATSLKIDSDKWNQFGFDDIDEYDIDTEKSIDNIEFCEDSLEEATMENGVIVIDCSRF